MAVVPPPFRLREVIIFQHLRVFDGKMMDNALATPTDNPDLSGLPPAIVATAGLA